LGPITSLNPAVKVTEELKLGRKNEKAVRSGRMIAAVCPVRDLLYVTRPAPDESVTPAVLTKVALKGTAVVSGTPELIKIKRVPLFKDAEERLARTQTVADVGAVGETKGALALDES
jgi:hypothetical protein